MNLAGFPDPPELAGLLAACPGFPPAIKGTFTGSLYFCRFGGWYLGFSVVQVSYT